METKINPQIWDIPGKYSSLKKMVRMLGAVGGLTVAISGLPVCAHAAPAAPKKPNIVVLWGDDIGYWNISAYNRGMMGYRKRRSHWQPRGVYRRGYSRAQFKFSLSIAPILRMTA